MTTIKVTAVEYYEIDAHAETGEPFDSPEDALEHFRVDPGYFDWDERKILSVELAKEKPHGCGLSCYSGIPVRV